MVGSTVITRKSGERVKRAEELGYFKFGGSTILLFFEPGRMVYDNDLIENSLGALETLVSQADLTLTCEWVTDMNRFESECLSAIIRMLKRTNRT